MLVKVPGRDDLNALEGWADNEHMQLLNLTYVSSDRNTKIHLSFGSKF